MNEKYIIVKDGVENIVWNGKIIGYQFKIRVPYYMGVPFSQIEFIKAKMDGKEIQQDKMRLVASSGDVFKMSEIITAYRHFWEYGEKLRVFVEKDGGLLTGKHKLEVEVGIDVIYTPKGFGSYSYQEFEIG